MGIRSDLTSTPMSATTASAAFDRSGPVLTAYLSGELDAASTPSISAAIEQHRRHDDTEVTLDLSEITFCDSSGIVLLFRLHEQLTDAGARFVLYQPTAPVRRVIHMCDPRHLMSIR